MKNAFTKELKVITERKQPKAFSVSEITGGMDNFSFSFKETTVGLKKSRVENVSSENFQDSIFNSIVDAVVVIDTDMMISRVNQAALLLTGFSEEELLNQPVELLSKNKGVLGRITDRKLQKKTVISGIETHCLRKDGKLIPISLSVSKIYDAQTETYSIVCVAQDITRRKRLEIESRAISEITKGISRTSNLDELLGLIHHSLKKILYAENCFVALHDKNTGLFTMRFFVDQYDKEAPPPLGLVRSCTRYVFRTQRPLLMNKEIFDSLVEQDEVDLVGAPPVCWIGTPLRTPTGIIGVLVVQHYEDENAYNRQDLDLLTSVGNQIAWVIERKQAEEALSKSEERFQLIARATNDAIWDWDLATDAVWWNEGFQKLFGYSADEAGCDVKSLTERLHPDDLERVTHDIRKLIDSGQQNWSNEYRFRCRDGSYAFVIDRGYIVYDQGKPVRMLGSMMDVTERKSLEQQLTHQALHDSLTKLANRVLFHDRVEHALSKLSRTKTSLAVLFIDLDNFKTINDSMGHAAGDALLISIGERLRACLRNSDTPARLGGDEFAILVEDVKHADEVILIAERLEELFRAPFLIDGKELFVGTSIGIASTQTGNEKPEELLRNADTAMYTAKTRGKGHYVVFETKMHEALMERVELEADLRRGIENKEFTLHYQPIIDLKSKQMTGMEALVRWNHPTRGLIPPNKFIPIAEETNQIVELGKWILDEACHQAKIWNNQYDKEQSLTISVNLSIRQFQQDKLIEMIETALTKSGLPARCLVLEITESLMLYNTEATIKKLQELKKIGIRLAIDDFGTGYSSLSYLQRFPLDILKIDKSFIDKISQSKEGVAVARAIIMMSDTLQLKTVAEGIEYPEQITTLQDLGCGLGQGFHFAKPLTTEDMNEFLLKSTLNSKNDLTD